MWNCCDEKLAIRLAWDECCKNCNGTGIGSDGDECIECRGRGDYVDEEMVCVSMFDEDSE